MTPQPIAPKPATSPWFASVTGTDQRGNQTIIQPGGLIEYATLATANRVMAILEAAVPEAGPYTLTDSNLAMGNGTMAWSQPQYGITGNAGPEFNAGLLWNGIRQGGYNCDLVLKQVRQAVIGY
jgi:hypothetical protein